MECNDFFLDKLNEEFQKRRNKNGRYSLRAYARFLGIDPSTLSKILHKKRPMPLTDALRIGKKLKLSPCEYQNFFFSVVSSRCMGDLRELEQKPGHQLTEELHFKIIVEWEYYAVLNLMSTCDFMADATWIAERLGISEVKAAEVWNDLLKANLITKKEGSYQRTHKSIETTDDIMSYALQLAHLKEMELAAKKITKVPTDERDFFSAIIPANPKALKKAKQLTREYCSNMQKILENGEKSEVYLLSTQLFPLTKKECQQ